MPVPWKFVVGATTCRRLVFWAALCLSLLQVARSQSSSAPLPTLIPTGPSNGPTLSPTAFVAQPVPAPTPSPTGPSTAPTYSPTGAPLLTRSSLTFQPTRNPTPPPTVSPTVSPTLSPTPSSSPTVPPSRAPSFAPPTVSPTALSSTPPSAVPSFAPNATVNRVQVAQVVQGVTAASLGNTTSPGYQAFAAAFKASVAAALGTVRPNDVTIVSITAAATARALLATRAQTSHLRQVRPAAGGGVVIVYIVVSGTLTQDQLSQQVATATVTGTLTQQLQQNGFPTAAASSPPTIVYIYITGVPSPGPTPVPVTTLNRTVSVSVGAIVGITIGGFFGAIVLIAISYYGARLSFARYQRYLDKEQMTESGLLRIPWSRLSIAGTDGTAATLGRGAYGVVVRAEWSTHEQPQSANAEGAAPRGARSRMLSGNTIGHTVAVKVTTRAMAVNAGRDFEAEKKRALAEALVVMEAGRRGGEFLREDLVEVLGFTEGPLPSALTAYFNVRDNEEAFGIVMRLEAGGSLEDMLHKRHDEISMTEKIRCLMLLCRGVEGLHAVGVVHGDLKTGNVLLSDKDPPDLRISDFGLAALRAETASDNGLSSIQTTSHAAGTPTYSAPEMLVSGPPGADGRRGQVARASRSTDVYALGIIAHEVLSRSKPFEGFSYAQLVNDVAVQGVRPSLDKLPPSTSPAVRSLIEACWSADRSQRPTATECYVVFAHEFEMLDKREFDIFFSHRWAQKPFLSQVYKMLASEGYRVWYDMNEMGFDLVRSMHEGIERSTVVVCCVDSGYMQRPNCMLELRHARETLERVHADSEKKRLKAIVTVLTESNIFQWGTDEFKDLLKVQTTMFVDMGELAARPEWESKAPSPKTSPVADDPADEEKEETHGPPPALLAELQVAMAPLLKILHEVGCRPSNKKLDLTNLKSPERLNRGPGSTPKGNTVVPFN